MADNFLKELGEALKEYVNESMGLEAEIDLDEDSVSVGVSLVFNEYDREAYLTLLCSSNNSLLVYIQFGKLEATLETYRLINEFNLGNPFYKALINEEGCFELQYTVLETAGVEETVNTVDFVVSRLFEDPCEALLRPIAERIEEEE